MHLSFGCGHRGYVPHRPDLTRAEILARSRCTACGQRAVQVEVLGGPMGVNPYEGRTREG